MLSLRRWRRSVSEQSDIDQFKSFVCTTISIVKLFERLRLAKSKTQTTHDVILERATRPFSLPSLSQRSQASVQEGFQSDVRTQPVQDVNLEIAMLLSSPVSSREFTKVQTVRMHEAISLRNITTTTFVVIPSTSATAHSSWSPLARDWPQSSFQSMCSAKPSQHHEPRQVSKVIPSGSSRRSELGLYCGSESAKDSEWIGSQLFLQSVSWLLPEPR